MYVTVWYGWRSYGTGEQARHYGLTISRDQHSPDQITLKFVLRQHVSGKTDSLSTSSEVSSIDLMFGQREALDLARDIVQICETSPPAQLQREVNTWPGAARIDDVS